MKEAYDLNKKYSVLKFAKLWSGLGEEIWKGIDPSKYINELRGEQD